MSTCKRCGRRVPKGQATCPGCGAPVERRRRWPLAALIISSLVIVACAVMVALWATGVIGGGTKSPLGPAGRGDAPVGEASGGGDGEKDDDPFVLLQPGFTSEKVTSEASARSVISGVASKLKIDDVETELVDCRETEANGNRYWRFSQSYEGIPVYGRGVTVGADDEGGALLLSSNFERMEGVPTEPAVSAEDAEAAARAAAADGATAVAGGTLVYSIGSVEPCLAWQVIVSSSDGIESVFVSADTADVVASEPLVLNGRARGTGTDKHTGEEISFNVWQDDDGSYRMFDDERNIDVFDANGATLTYELVFESSDGTKYYLDPDTNEWRTDAGKVDRSEVDDHALFVDMRFDVNNVFKDVTAVTSDTTEFSNSTAASALVRINSIYDLYQNVLGREGFDNESGHLDLVVNDFMWEGWSIDSGNAYSFTPFGSGTTLISVGSENEGAVDTLGHEYTHSVETSISGMVSSGESGALKEATSDIMGEISQDYFDDGQLDGDADWIHGIRNLVDPSRSTQSERGDDKDAHPTRYQDDRWGNPSDDYDNGYVHNNSTVVGHAAYLMCNDTGLDGESLDTEQMALLVYGTFHALTSDSSFSQFRTCMELTARIMIEQGDLSSENLTRISAAFDAVNIRAADNNDFISDDDEKKVEEAVTKIKGSRDVALVLDVSGSMDGEPIESMRAAATEFVSRAASPDVRVGLVAYSSSSTALSPLSSNLGSLGSSIAGLTSGGGTNMDAGLQDGMQLLGSAAQDRRRIVVLMSDGLPNDGRTGDELVAYVDSLKQDGVKVYTLSFGDDEQGRALLAQLASEGCSFNANNTDELEGFFSDIADEISGTAFIRAELACPVDVTVTLNGETLSSDPDRLCTRTSFGSLTIEEAPEGDGTTTKVLRLREGEPYDIQITGTDTGTMDYTIGFMDENGDYTDSRSFPQIGVTPTTRMETRAERADETTLRVDENGDGVTDSVWRATAGGTAEPVDSSGVAWATVAGCVVVAGGVTALRVRSLMRRRRELRTAA